MLDNDIKFEIVLKNIKDKEQFMNACQEILGTILEFGELVDIKISNGEE